MLNTQVTEKGILVTDNDGNEVGKITYGQSLWVADHTHDALPIKAFFSRQAAEYYMLAAHLEHIAEV